MNFLETVESEVSSFDESNITTNVAAYFVDFFSYGAFKNDAKPGNYWEIYVNAAFAVRCIVKQKTPKGIGDLSGN